MIFRKKCPRGGQMLVVFVVTSNPTLAADALFILYVADQHRSAEFYGTVLDVEPTLNVPGMTEYPLTEHSKLGLMPEAGIAKLLGEVLPDPSAGAGVPRAELYLRVHDPAAFHQRALDAGASELSPLRERDWGDAAAYSLDLDGHVLVFASLSE